jgi:hypothetical protein
MKMTKSDLRSMIREVLKEELLMGSYLTEGVTSADNLIATYICNNPGFETACLTGDATQIMAIIDAEMEANNMYTPGAKKLRNDVFRMTRGNAKVPAKIGEHILFFVWNSQLSGTGDSVIKVG